MVPPARHPKPIHAPNVGLPRFGGMAFAMYVAKPLLFNVGSVVSVVFASLNLLKGFQPFIDRF